MKKAALRLRWTVSLCCRNLQHEDIQLWRYEHEKADNKGFVFMKKTGGITAAEYLSHAYEIPRKWPDIPMEDEPFVRLWQEASGRGALDFLSDEMKLPTCAREWENTAAISISFARTVAGRLPVLSTESHRDFRQMEALLNAREALRELPPTVNAFAMVTRAESIFRHRVLLLNRAPYSNIPAEKLGLSEADWLERSHKLRLRHECAHYETLRILGDMENHAHDEILADALGQIAAFGNFSAWRQRLFFGLERGNSICQGRLSFYCQQLMPGEREKVYRAVDMALDSVEEQLSFLSAKNVGELEIFAAMAGVSIAERIARFS